MPPKQVPSLQTRRSLLSRLKDWHDQDSWQQFYDIYSNLIFGVALGAGLTHEEAQDALQETVFTVAKQLTSENGEKPAFTYDPAVGSFKNWLLHTTRWKINDQFRKRGPLVRKPPRRDSRTNKTPTEAQIPDPNGDELEAKFEREYKETLQERALDKVKHSVKAKHYQVYDLYVIKQWPTEKVAQVLGLNAGQVFLIKHRIVGIIKKEVQRLQKEVL
jgi:RNA polymerase sigma-70 factor (ECF subfamily)